MPGLVANGFGMGVGFGGQVIGLIVPVVSGWKAAGIKARAAGITRRDTGGDDERIRGWLDGWIDSEFEMSFVTSAVLIFFNGRGRIA